MHQIGQTGHIGHHTGQIRPTTNAAGVAWMQCMGAPFDSFQTGTLI